MTHSTLSSQHIPPAPTVAYLHLRDRGKSTGRAQAAVHGELIPNDEVLTALVRRSEALELATRPELVQWCPDCLDEHQRRVEEHRAKELRTAASNARATRMERLLHELRETARAGDLASMTSILDELDEIDASASTAGEV